MAEKRQPKADPNTFVLRDACGNPLAFAVPCQPRNMMIRLTPECYRNVSLLSRLSGVHRKGVIDQCVKFAMEHMPELSDEWEDDDDGT